MQAALWYRLLFDLALNIALTNHWSTVKVGFNRPIANEAVELNMIRKSYVIAKLVFSYYLLIISVSDTIQLSFLTTIRNELTQQILLWNKGVWLMLVRVMFKRASRVARKRDRSLIYCLLRFLSSFIPITRVTPE